MGVLTCVQYSAFCSSQFPHPRNKRYFWFSMCLESWCDAWIQSQRMLFGKKLHSLYSLWHSPSKALQHQSLVKSSSYFPVCHWTLFVHVKLLLLFSSIDFWPLFSPHRVTLITTAGSLQCLHQIKSNRKNVSLKPISSFCSWKHMFETSEEFSAYNRSGHFPAHV